MVAVMNQNLADIMSDDSIVRLSEETSVVRLADETATKMRIVDEALQTQSLDTSTLRSRSLETSNHQSQSLDVSALKTLSQETSTLQSLEASTQSLETSMPETHSPETSTHQIQSPETSTFQTQSLKTSSVRPRSLETSTLQTQSLESSLRPRSLDTSTLQTQSLDATPQLNGMIKSLVKVDHESLQISDLDSSSSSDCLNVSISSDTRCSHTLPMGNIISAVVASRWDDIMGPRTIRVWLPPTLSESLHTLDSASRTANVSIKTACEFYCRHQMVGCTDTDVLMKAIKYVTVHTNYTCITGLVPPDVGGTSVLVVPALNAVAQSNLFHLPLKGSCPHSVALLMDYSAYEDYLHMRPLANFWLQKLSSLLSEHLLLEAGADGCPPSTILDAAILEMCVVMQSLRTRGLSNPRTAQNLIRSVTLNFQALGLALTSHLQTAGCTAVIGDVPQDINAVISFLALFLDKEARGCSRLLSQDSSDKFSVGLYLQGLQVDQVRGDFNAHDLAGSPLPVTWVNLHRPSVYQSLPLHVHRGREINPTVRSVREESSLVTSFLRDISLLPLAEWSDAAKRFMRHVHYLALTLLSLLHWSGAPSGTLHLNPNEPNGQIMSQLKKLLNLDTASILVVLAAAEQLKPGVYRLVI